MLHQDARIALRCICAGPILSLLTPYGTAIYPVTKSFISRQRHLPHLYPVVHCCVSPPADPPDLTA